MQIDRSAHLTQIYLQSAAVFFISETAQTMSTTVRQKACIACAESKRRCDRQLPTCQRCLDLDGDCTYPQRKKRQKVHHLRGDHDDGGSVVASPELDYGDIDRHLVMESDFEFDWAGNGTCGGPWHDADRLE